jgi:hypothetical protein
MDRILDVIRITQERFTAFAEEWVEIPEHFYEEGVIRYGDEHIIIGFLVENGVFSADEIRTTLVSRGIYLGDDVYRKAFEAKRK